MTDVIREALRSESVEGRSTDDTHPLFARRFGARTLDALFPVHDRAAALAGLVSAGAQALEPFGARFGAADPSAVDRLPEGFAAGLPEHPTEDTGILVDRIATTFLRGAVDWRNPSLQVNVGTSPTLAASALYSLGLDANVYLINDGLAGHVIEAETLVSDTLSNLAGILESQARGLFVFGGTGTIMYGIRAGFAKASPDIDSEGVSKDCFVAITEEAHFSHARSARWLGLGDKHIVTLPSDERRITRFEDACKVIEDRIAAGGRLAALVLNGGTTYDHSVDDVPRFRLYIDDLVERYDLDYRPHIHVDSVIGWEWLFFRDYTFPPGYGVALDTQRMLLEQSALVASAIQNADSWGADFHKGTGSCPVDCSVVQFNDARDLALLNGAGRSEEMHQVAPELSTQSPADYTLETSRAGAKALAALGSLHALGAEGYRTVLAGLVDAAQTFRRQIDTYADLQVENPYSLGYQSMVRIYPPGLAGSPLRTTERIDNSAEQRAFTASVNDYTRRFIEWDENERMSHGAAGPYYSYSSKFVQTPSGAGLTSLKFYPTSPRFANAEARDTAIFLHALKTRFDRGA